MVAPPSAGARPARTAIPQRNASPLPTAYRVCRYAERGLLAPGAPRLAGDGIADELDEADEADVRVRGQLQCLVGVGDLPVADEDEEAVPAEGLQGLAGLLLPVDPAGPGHQETAGRRHRPVRYHEAPEDAGTRRRRVVAGDLLADPGPDETTLTAAGECAAYTATGR
jgi:hypothetical protein